MCGKKESIYKAAVKVIARKGFDNMKIQMVADEAQIAVGTIYNYFKSKDDILGYIICLERQKRANFLDELEKGSQPALEKIKAYLHFHLDALINDLDAGKILVQEVVLTGPALNENIKPSMAEMQERLFKLITRAQEEGTVRNSNPKILLATLLNTVKGFMYSLMYKNDINGYPEMKIQAVNFLINGIKV